MAAPVQLMEAEDVISQPLASVQAGDPLERSSPEWRILAERESLHGNSTRFAIAYAAS